MGPGLVGISFSDETKTLIGACSRSRMREQARFGSRGRFATHGACAGSGAVTANKGVLMATVGLIGAGNIGGTVARLAVAAGYEVVLSNRRGPEVLEPLLARLGKQARAATPEEAARAGDIVVVTVPLHQYRSIPVEPLLGKIVIDTNNYYPGRDGNIPELDSEESTTSELLQAHLSESKVVKGFNNISFWDLGQLARAAGAPDRTTLPIAGDDLEAKRAVTEFFNTIGYDAVDVGPLAEGWRFQRDLPAYVSPYMGTGEVGSPSYRSTPAGKSHVSAALLQAKRYREM